ncbi:MAG: UTP--glucose-1-phosphate uridylyltransferase [Spirochaetota bacterium]
MSIEEQLSGAGIDAALSLQILRSLQEGKLHSGQTAPAHNFEIPRIDGEEIIDLSSGFSYHITEQRARRLLRQFPELRSTGLGAGKGITLNQIHEIGLILSTYYAFGVLNGGSASSYFDYSKNQAYSPALFSLLEKEFNSLATDYAARPKALCPAYLQADGSRGPSFMGLKLRSLLHLIHRQARQGQSKNSPRTQFFQMTSQLTHEPLEQYAREGWKSDPLAAWAGELDWQPEKEILSARQPLIAAYDYNGGRWDFWRDANRQFLPMPGGHGQCFFALRGLFRQLYDSGTRYISLGNIDNIAYNPQPLFIGLLALSGRTGFFASSYRSSIDVKGGVLLRPHTQGQKTGTQSESRPKLNCYDIGVGVSPDILPIAEQQDRVLLFNCAIGYFDLGQLLAQIDDIIRCLPIRVSEQNKDRGHYWQVEQVSWEAIGLLDTVLLGAVRKEDHFLAAKLQLETFINTAYRSEQYPGTQLKHLAARLSTGYRHILKRDCALSMP